MVQLLVALFGPALMLMFWLGVGVAIVTAFLWLITWPLRVLFGAKPRVIEPSGVHGTADTATVDDIKAGGLLGHKWGHGIRLGYAWDVKEWLSDKIMRYVGENSLITFGAPGTGKMTDLIAPAMWENRDRHIINICPKGQAAPMTIEQRRKIGKVKTFYATSEGLPEGVAELLGPTDTYNPMPALLKVNSAAFVSNADAFSSTVVAEDGDHEQAFFVNGARRVVSGVMQGLMLYYPPEKQNLGEVARIITTREVFNFVFDCAKRRGSEYIMQRLGFLAEPGASSDKTVTSILDTADNALSFLCNPNVANLLGGTSGWCFADLKKETEPMTVYVLIAAKFVSSSPLLRIFAGSAMQELMATTRGPLPVLFIIDEFANLGKVPVFETAFAQARGYGIAMWVFLQNIPQMMKLYGANGWQSFLSGAQIQTYLGTRDPETARFLSDSCGNKTVVLPQFSYSAQGHENVGYGEHQRPLYTPHEIMGLSRNTFLLFARGLVSNVIVGMRRPYMSDDELKKKAIIGTDPYHEPLKKRKPGNGPHAAAERVTVRCAHCSATGQIQSASYGCKLRCPSCRKEFWTNQAA